MITFLRARKPGYRILGSWPCYSAALCWQFIHSGDGQEISCFHPMCLLSRSSDSHPFLSSLKVMRDWMAQKVWFWTCSLIFQVFSSKHRMFQWLPVFHGQVNWYPWSTCSVLGIGSSGRFELGFELNDKCMFRTWRTGKKIIPTGT